jgi:hypothetical protein
MDELVKFEIPHTDNLIEALRRAEFQAPKELKPLLIQAANRIRQMQEAMEGLAGVLETAQTLRAGAVDSENRHMEVSNTIRATLLEVSTALRQYSDKAPKVAA